nr:hypothetical protein [Vibrio gangliei]
MALIELIIVVVILSVVGLVSTTYFNKIANPTESASIAKSYVKDLELAIKAKTAQQWQDCVDFQDFTFEQLASENWLINPEQIFPTSFVFDVERDKTNRRIPRMVTIQLSFQDRAVANTVAQSIPHSKVSTNESDSIVSIGVRISPFSRGMQYMNNEYTQLQLPPRVGDKYCFDRTAFDGS